MTDLKSKIKEILLESRDESSNFEEFFATFTANTIPILCKSSIDSTIDVLQSADLLKIEDD